MIVPIALVLAVYTARKAMKSQEKRTETSDRLRLFRIFPWFVFGFVLAAVVNTFLPLPGRLPEALTAVGKFLIVMAMVAIGLNTNLKKLLASGAKPVTLGLCCWFVVSATSLAGKASMGML